MNDYKWVTEISRGQLSNRALVLLSQFSRTLKKVTGRHLNLQDADLTTSLLNEIGRTDNAELHSIFNVLLDEFHSAVELKMSPELNRRDMATRVGLGRPRVNAETSNKFG